MQAVKVLHAAIEVLPMDYSLLDCQSTFCQSKGRLDWALECAKRGVTAAPSEFGTWARLAEIYVGREQWDLALLTLNSCPMFTYQDKDAPRMPEPARVLLPVLPESNLDELDESPPGLEHEVVHPSLRKLHAAGYKGTFLKAYSILTEITAKIGWDQLLRIRSQVFVMEEEYRSEKQTGGSSQRAANHNASTTALRGTPSPGTNGDAPRSHVKGDEDDDDDDDDGGTSASASSKTAEDETNGSISNSVLITEEPIEKPEHTITSEVVKAGNDDVRLVSSFPCFHPFSIHLFSFQPAMLTPWCISPLLPQRPSLKSTISAFVNGGSTISSWSSMKICAFTPFGGPTWRGPSRAKRRLPNIKSQPRSGRSWAS